MQNWARQHREIVSSLVRGVGRIAGRAATLDGRRSTVDWLQDEFFLAMADEMETSGVTQRIAAGMFGVSRRTYLRQKEAARQRQGMVGGSLWWSVREVLSAQSLSREAVMARFANRNERVIASILRDMLENGWLSEQNGLLVVTQTSAPWTEELLTQYVESARHIRPPATLGELVSQTGLAPDVVERVLQTEEEASGRARAFSVSPNAFERLAGLALVSQSFLAALYTRLADVPNEHRVVLHSVSLERAEEPLRRFRETFDAAVRAHKDANADVLADTVDGVAGSTRYTSVFVETVTPAVGWDVE